MDILLHAAQALHPSVLQPFSRQTLIGEVLMQLYCRIATCLHYHSRDLPKYLQAWSCWTAWRKEAVQCG